VSGDEIYYADRLILFGNLILTEHLHKALSMPVPSSHNSRGFYFKNSYYGKKYKMLIRRDHNYLINAETEYSESVFKPVLDSVSFKQNINNVLLLGLGTGELIYKIKEIKPNCNITVIEVRSELAKYKNKIYDGEFKWLNVSVKDYDQIKDKLDKYDVIIDDIDYKLPHKIPFVENNLTENGCLYFMSNYKIYKETPYNFIAVNNDLTINKIDDRIPDNVIDVYKKFFKDKVMPW
jgi:hypothetical protein